MKTVRYMLTLLALLVWGAAARADYNPPDPPEPGVNFTLTTSRVPSDGGSLNVGASQVYAFGTSVRLVAYPATGFVFTGWKDIEGNILSAATDYTFTMPARDIHVTATFRYDPGSPAEPDVPVIRHYSRISYSCDPSAGGSISTSFTNGSEYEVGKRELIRAYPSTGFVFVNWTQDADTISTSPDFYYTLPSGDPHLVAHFRYDPSSPGEPGTPHITRQLTLRSNMEGAVSSLYGGGSVLEGSNVRVYTSNVNTYYTFINWTDEEDNVVSEARDFQYTMPDRNVTLTANFSYFYNPDSPGEPGVPDIDDSVAPNTVYRPRFAMEGIDHVVILCETDGVDIFYTLDGSTPDRNSSPYTGPVFVGSNLVVKAVAYKEGMYDSPVGTYQVRSYRVADPTFGFEDFKVVIRSATPGAVIRYTLDYTEPDEESPVYTDPFVPEEDCRVKAYASKEGLTDSNVSKYAYRKYDYTVRTPEFVRTSDRELEITTPTPGAVIYYTLDGTDPTAENTPYTEPLTLTRNCTVKALALKDDFFESAIGTYVVDDLGLPTPVATFAAQHIVLSCDEPAATIVYTLDGTAPTAESDVYTAPFLPEHDCTVLFAAMMEGYNPSETGEFVYVKADRQAATPSIIEEEGMIVMTCRTEGAAIRYTLDGSVPNEESTLYETPLPSDRNRTYRAITFHVDLLPSETAELIVEHFRVSIPKAEFKNQHIVLTGVGAADKIRYTLDDSAPTATVGTEYVAPFLPEADCTVRFIGYRDGYRESEVGSYEYKLAENRTAAPVITEADGKVTITCATAGATIHYTEDGSIPTENSPVYTAPLTSERNCTYKAMATHSDLLPSAVSTLEITGYIVATPSASFKIQKIVLTPADAADRIRYTVDGSDPTATVGTEYTAPFLPEADCMVRFIGYRDGYRDSEVGSYEYKLAENRTAAPVITEADGKVTMTCATAGATIHYTEDGSIPTENSPVYTAPLTSERNCTYKAMATHSDLLPSDVAELVVGYFVVPVPEATYGAHHVTLTCSDPEAEIYYTLDGADPLAEGKLYMDSVEVSDDADFTFAARREGYHDSTVGRYEFRIADYRLAKPIITPYYMDDRLVVEADTTSALRADGLRIAHTLAEYTTSETIWEIKPSEELFTDDFHSLLYACATSEDPDLYDSEIAEFEVYFWYEMPEISHDGYNFKISSRSGAVEIFYFDIYRDNRWVELPRGIYPADGWSEPLPTYCQVAARTVGDGAFPIHGEKAMANFRFSNSYFFDFDAQLHDVPTIGGTSVSDFKRACGVINEDQAREMEELVWKIEGSRDTDESLRYLAERFTGLRALELQSDSGITMIPDSVFASMPHLNTLWLPESLTESSALLAGLPELTTLRWRNYSRPLPTGILGYAENPNMILWTANNEVDRDCNVVYNRNADKIVITDGYPFSAGTSDGLGSYWNTGGFIADAVEYEREFSQTTPAPGEGNGRGWETIALPFDVQSIEHESKGEIVPFAAREESAEGKPFWLYEADTESTWKAADAIRANVPYIIAMPEHEYYADEYRLAGKVRFRAENVSFRYNGSDDGGDNSSFEVRRPDGIDFCPVIGPRSMEIPGHFMGLNVGMDDCYDDEGRPFMPGSAFVAGIETKPMHAYMRGGADISYLPIFGSESGVGEIYAEDTLSVEALRSRIRLLSGSDRTVEVYTTTGLRVAVLNLKAGESALTEPLVPGIYIVAGRKVRVD